MIWEMYQQQAIGEASLQATRADSKATRNESELSILRRQTDNLALACQALWELLRENSGFTDDRLRAKMQEIDLRDGNSDGRMSQRTINCPACGAASNTRRSSCLMCGALLVKEHIFE